jgi:glycosyltransferase involved in cell wall biosynthesis
MNKILIFSSVIPKEHEKYYFENSIGAMSNANNSLQWALVNGFILNGFVVKMVNFPNIGAYPSKFKKLITKTYDFTNGGSVFGINIGVLNLNVLKHLFFYFRLKVLLRDEYFFKDHNTLLIYDLYPPFLKVLKKIKQTNPSLKIILVVPDIHGFTGGSNSLLRKFVQFFDQSVIDRNIIYTDAFVLLTSSMIEKLPKSVQNKPIVIVEGILNPDNYLIKSSNNLALKTKKIILYTGSLDVRHGIMNLIKAFIMASFIDSELHICGDGDGKSEILKIIKGHESIKYLGQLSRESVIVKQRDSFLLVNPRTSEGEFTKYSFPSKIIEYLASGTPTLIYKLEGIPEEYYNFCYYLEDESVEALSSKIIEILQEDEKLLNRKGILAKEFILNKKNAVHQVEKIINLI